MPNDINNRTVGASTLESIDEWILEYPSMDGIFIDSLGALWPALLNYRHDHFPYARYPLSFDPDGRIALHNQISHYEFLETLLTKLRSGGRYLWGNGVYDYNASTNPPEHYLGATRLGRFFIASLLDVSVSEPGVSPAQERWEFVRTSMGKKFATLLNYDWEDVDEVDRYINKSLCYAVFGTNSRNPFTGVHYVDNPNGNLRDKDLLDWFIPNVRMLSHAGWEPATFAEIITGNNIHIERYGSGDVVYFALYSEYPDSQSCTLKLEMDSLGFDPGETEYSEIARSTSLAISEPNITLTLDPYKTCIIRLSR